LTNSPGIGPSSNIPAVQKGPALHIRDPPPEDSADAGRSSKDIRDQLGLFQRPCFGLRYGWVMRYDALACVPGVQNFRSEHSWHREGVKEGGGNAYANRRLRSRCRKGRRFRESENGHTSSRPRQPVTNFVLVPGAWLGAWAYKDVARRLEEAGDTAYPITLTRMAERVHLLTQEVGMETAIQDVLNVIHYNEIDRFVLVGHSFAVAGKVAAAGADRAHAKVPRALYLDAVRPERVPEPQGGFDPRKEFGSPPPGGLGIPLTEAIIERIGPDLKGEILRRMRKLATPWPEMLATDLITLSPH